MPGLQQEASPNPSTFATTQPVESWLRSVRRGAWFSLVFSRLGILIAALVLITLQAAFVDYWLRGPMWLRTVMWGAMLLALLHAIRRFIVPSLRFQPNLIDLALRLERTPQAAQAGLAGSLASAIDLAQRPTEGSVESRALAAKAVNQAIQRYQALTRPSLLKPGPLALGLVLLACSFLTIVGVRAWAGSELASIGAKRILLPFTGTLWPKRTQIVDATESSIRAIAQPLELRAKLTKTDHARGRTRVWLNYRVLENGGATTPIRLPITSRETVGEAGSAPADEFYETTLEPRLLITSSDTAAQAQIEYWFETNDDATTPATVLLVHPPEVLAASAVITPPAYAAKILAEGRAGFILGPSELGPGIDQRAVVGPVLAGSQIQLAIDFTKPVPMPTTAATKAAPAAPANDETLPASSAENTAATATTDPSRAALQQLFPGIDFGPDLRATWTPTRWTLHWTLERSTRLSLAPVDEHGVASVRESVFSFDVMADQPPTVAMTKPKEDETVLATAIVDLTGEARDDVSIGSLALQSQRARPPAGSVGASAEAIEEPATLIAANTADQPQTTDAPASSSHAAATLDTRLELAPLDLKPGDEVWITALAQDIYERDGVAREPVRSSPRRLRIIAPQDLVNQVRSAMNAVRDAAIRLDEEQGKLQQPVTQRLVSGAVRQRQAALGPRISQQREAIEQLRERIERNRLEDATLDGMLQDAASLLDEAQRASDLASTQLEQAAQGEDPVELTPEQSQQTGQQQEQVRDRLGQLVKSLDRGQDNWLVRRDLQRLLEQQRELQEQTRRTGEETVGRQQDQLSPQQRSELSAQAQRQQQLSDQAMRVMDELSARAEQLKKNDPAQSQAMKQAVQRGRQSQVQRAMEQASKALEQNQTSQAQEQQQQAEQALEQMLQDMDAAQRSQDEALRRTLLSLVESIEGLIAGQQREIAILTQRRQNNDFQEADQGLRRLHVNTLGTLEQARPLKEAAAITKLLEEAGAEQSKAIQALRRAPMTDADAAEADAAEHASLTKLQEALAEAKKLEDQAQKKDANRQRTDLRRAYRDALEQQAVLRAETEGFAGKGDQRRDRLKIRALGDRQDGLRAVLDDLRKKTTEIEEAKLFAFAHDRLERVGASAAKRLRGGKVDSSALRDQDSAITVLKLLVEALSQDPKDDDFRESPESQESGGGGSGPGGAKNELVPPLAELKMLRGMQDEAMGRTRAVGDTPPVGDAAEELQSIGEFQRRLALEGVTIVEKMKKQQQPQPSPDGLPEMPEQPGSDPSEEPSR